MSITSIKPGSKCPGGSWMAMTIARRIQFTLDIEEFSKKETLPVISSNMVLPRHELRIVYRIASCSHKNELFSPYCVVCGSRLKECDFIESSKIRKQIVIKKGKHYSICVFVLIFNTPTELCQLIMRYND